jgi:hypothetical protein
MAKVVGSVDARDVMKDTELVVDMTGLVTVSWRITIGAWFIKLGAKIMGCGLRIEDTNGL